MSDHNMQHAPKMKTKTMIALMTFNEKKVKQLIKQNDLDGLYLEAYKR